MADGQTNGNGNPLANGGNGKPNTYGHSEIDRLEEIVANVYSMRNDFLRGFQDMGDGELDNLCSWPSPDVLQASFYKTLYDRTSIATRVCQLYPKECWQVTPLVYEDESSQHITPFEAAWDGLGKKLTGIGKSWHREEQGSLIWSYLQRADELSGIGVYGLILLGINDGKLLEQPLEGVVPDGASKDISGISSPGTTGDDGGNSKNLYGDMSSADLVNPLASTMGTDAQYFQTSFSPMYLPNGQTGGKSSLKMKGKGKQKELLFLRCFDESLVQVVQYEASMRSPRFGQPIMYQITLNDPTQPHTGIGLPLATVRVHWSRVIHLADNLGSSEIFGVPRQRPCVNNIMDLRKLYGGSAEMYWRGAFPGLSIETHPQLGGDVLIDRQGLRDMMTDYHQRLQRWISLMGMSAKSLAPQVVDPTPQIAIQLEAICIYLGCPIRVFKGSERGELASAQDDAAWNDRLRHRQNLYLTPRVVAPFIDRLIQIGVLPEPNAKASDGGSKAEPGRGPKSLRKDNPFLNGKGTVGGKRLSELGKNGNSGDDEDDVRNAFGKDQEDDGAQDGKGGNPFASSNDQFGRGNGKKNLTKRGPESPNEDMDGETEDSIEEEQEPGYSIEWPDLDSLGDKDKAQIALTETQAMAAYLQGDVESLVPRRDYFIRTLHWEDEEADAVIADAAQQEEEKQQEAEDLAAEQGLEPTPPEGFQKPMPPGGFPPPAGGPPGSGGGGQPPPNPKAPPAGPGKPPQGQTSQKGGNQSQAQYGGFKGARNTAANGAAIKAILGKYIEDQLEGLLVYLNEAEGKAIVDRMDWYEGGQYKDKKADPATEVATALKDWLGEDAVEEVNEGARPMGKGWVELVREVTRNANPEGCNQYTGPGCSGGGDKSTKELSDDARDASAHAMETTDPSLTPLDTLFAHADAADTAAGDARGWLKNGNLEKAAVSHEMAILDHHQIVRRAKDPKVFSAHQDAEHAHLKARDAVVDEMVRKGGHESWLTSKAVEASRFTDASKNDMYPRFGTHQMMVRWHSDQANHHDDEADRRHEKEKAEPAYAHEEAAYWHRKAADAYERGATANAFCPTGKGGGVDPSCGSGNRTNGAAESTPADHTRFDRVMGLGEFVHKRVGEILDQAGDKGATLRQIARGINGKGSTVYGDISHGEIRAALDALEVSYHGDSVKLIKHTRNQFCPTGQGGGIDATCSPASTSATDSKGGLKAKAKQLLAKVWGKGRELEHKYLEKHYEAGQALAKQVARERGLSDKHVERMGRILAYADSAARWTQWYGVHAALDLIGGPIAGGVGAKASYYVPTASLAYIGLHMTKEAAGGKNPVALINKARETLKAAKVMGPPAPAPAKGKRTIGPEDFKGSVREKKRARLGLEELPQRNQNHEQAQQGTTTEKEGGESEEV